MKTILFFFLMLSSASVWGQSSWGVQAGFALNSTKPGIIPKFTSSWTGFYVGVHKQIPLSKNFDFIPEIQFAQRHYGTWDPTRLNYLEIPLLFSYSPVKVFAIEAGPNVSALAFYEDKGKSPQFPKGRYVDFGVNFGVRVRVSNRFSITTRYYGSIVSIAEEIYYQNGKTITNRTYTQSIQVGTAFRIK